METHKSQHDPFQYCMRISESGDVWTYPNKDIEAACQNFTALEYGTRRSCSPIGMAESIPAAISILSDDGWWPIILLFVAPHASPSLGQHLKTKGTANPNKTSQTIELGTVQLIGSQSNCLTRHAKFLNSSFGQLILTISPAFSLPFTTSLVTLTVCDGSVLEGLKVLACLIRAAGLKLNTKWLKSACDFLTIHVESIEQLKNLRMTSCKLRLSRQRHISGIKRSLPWKGVMKIRIVPGEFECQLKSFVIISSA
jgi:hypothetical protein